MFLKTLLVFVAIVAIFVILVLRQPSDYRTTRSVTVAASPAAVFAQINDLHQFRTWNPFGKNNPSMKTSFDGPANGPGSSFSWAGDSQVGEGRMTITETRPNELVRMRLDFIKPFPSVATADFTLEPRGNGTVVTWSMYGQRSFVPKAVGVFMDMDKMIGGEFEKGLAEMKTIVESPTAK